MEEDRKGFLTVVEALKLVGLLHQIPVRVGVETITNITIIHTNQSSEADD